MKKFISFAAIITLLISTLSCRETEIEDIITVPKTNYVIEAKMQNDSLEVKEEVHIPENFNVINEKEEEEEKDPPKKDPIRW